MSQLSILFSIWRNNKMWLDMFPYNHFSLYSHCLLVLKKSKLEANCVCGIEEGEDLYFSTYGKGNRGI